MIKIVLSDRATADLASIADYISQDSPRHADALLDKFSAEFVSIAQNPKIYRLRPDIDVDTRIAIVGNYLTLFLLFEDHVRVIRVVHGSRDIPNLLQ